MYPLLQHEYLYTLHMRQGLEAVEYDLIGKKMVEFIFIECFKMEKDVRD